MHALSSTISTNTAVRPCAATWSCTQFASEVSTAGQTRATAIREGMSNVMCPSARRCSSRGASSGRVSGIGVGSTSAEAPGSGLKARSDDSVVEPVIFCAKRMSSRNSTATRKGICSHHSGGSAKAAAVSAWPTAQATVLRQQAFTFQQSARNHFRRAMLESGNSRNFALGPETHFR